MGKGAEQRILFRGGDALQAARRLDAIVPVVPAFEEAEVPRAAAAVECGFERPLA
jgi:hypothetical protein